MLGKQLGNRRGQSIVEYLIVAAAVIAAVVVFGGKLGKGIENVGADSQKLIENGGKEVAKTVLGKS